MAYMTTNENYIIHYELYDAFEGSINRQYQVSRKVLVSFS